MGPAFIPVSQLDNLSTNNTLISTPDIPIVTPSILTPTPEPTIVRLKDPRPKPSLRKSNRSIVRPARYTNATKSRYSQAANFLSHQCNAVIDPTTGFSLKYRHLVKGDDSIRWTTGFANELGRLVQGVGTRMPTGTNTINFIARKDVPVNRTVTYGRIVATIRPTKADTRRVFLTVDGDRIIYSGDKSTPTADLQTIKTLLNSTISTPNATFFTSDIKDFYLNTPLSTFEYIRLQINIIPDEIITQYNLLPLFVNESVYIKIRKGMYGLPQAGKIAYDRLRTHLLQYGYTPTPLTPDLWRHSHRPIFFTLVVDDFGIKSEDIQHTNHLNNALRDLYTITTDHTGSLYYGMTLEWKYKQKDVDESMPGYVSKALHKILHAPHSKPQHSPFKFVRPNYGSVRA